MIDVDALADVCFSKFGKPATYTPPLGSSVNVTVITASSISSDPSGGELSVIGLAETADVRKSEVALPVRNAVLIVYPLTLGVDGVTYRVAEVDPPSPNISRMFLELT